MNQAHEVKQLKEASGRLRKKLAELVVENDDLRFATPKML